ncbi:MAG: sensor histidine kinase [Pyrinomonadaceae bacterium]
MSPLEVLQLVGYSTGAALHLWMTALLWKRRRRMGKIERVLLALAAVIGVWHASNFLIALHALLGLERTDWALIALRLSDSFAVVSIVLAYSLLLHVHLYLWADAQTRPLTQTERGRVFLSYLPALFLFISVPHLWTGAYAPLLDKLAQIRLPYLTTSFVKAFLLWAIYVLALIAATDLLIARKRTTSPNERRLMQTLAASFLCIAALLCAVIFFRRNGMLGLYLQTFANLGSLLPTALLVYHVYRYRYLELIIRESLVVASFAAIVLVIYLYGIRFISDYLTAQYGLRAGAIEMILTLALALSAAPLRRWLDHYFQKIVARDSTLYRDIVARIGAHAAGRHEHLTELLHYIEERAMQTLKLRRVRIVATQNATTRPASDNVGDEFADEEKLAELARRFCEAAQGERKATAIVYDEGTLGFDEADLREQGFDVAYALRRDARVLGVMFVGAQAEALTDDVRATLEVLAGQIAIALEDAWLVEENLRLEQRLAQDERLASLGRMAATVAHEVKNPLSAIKSIAQVMREDEGLDGEYARDLELIVGETNRLSRSVTQMLDFARAIPPDDPPCRVENLLLSIITLFRAEASKRDVAIELANACPQIELNGAQAAALREAFSNLLLNALHATAPDKRILVEAYTEKGALFIAVTDGGAGVAAEIGERIWEPFFTTKQRGTGLGLAIVRKRIEEVGGTARLAAARVENGGARFELSVPHVG